MHREGGQATVEWMGLVLAAALVLAAVAAFSSREADRGLGELVAKRIVRTSSGLRAAPASPVSAAPAPAPPASVAPAPAPPAPAARAVDAFRRLRGVGHVAKHAWIACLGYRRWRYELEHPSAPSEALPVGAALDIANDCLNPYDYLFSE